jgi:hypothetical protein
MEVAIKDNTLSVGIFYLLDQLSTEDKLSFIDTLSCEDDIIHMVADQLVYGYTNDGSSGGSYHDPSQLTVLNKYRRLVAKSASDRAKEEIEDLEIKVKSLKKGNAKLLKYAWRAYHQFNLRLMPLDILKGKML